MDVSLTARLLAACFAALVFAPAPALATPLPGSTAPAPLDPGELPSTPAGYSIDAREALARAAGEPEVAEQAERHGRLETAIEADDGEWQVGYKVGAGEQRREVVQVRVNGRSGEVEEVWTGYQVAWPMARGYEGQFGHALNAPWVWLPLCAIFLVGLIEWRRPLRAVHLDLAVLLAFGASHYFFNRGEIGLSVPLVYPVLAYLLARALWLGFRGGDGLRPTIPWRWLALAAIALCLFRVTLNVADSGVIDVGYAGVIGAERIADGDPIYGEHAFPNDNPHGDTYGPANYYAYVPFELALPWSGEWDELRPAHAAAIVFDLAAVLGLIAFGLRMRPGERGRELAAILAFAWLAYPYTAFALQSNANDALLAALIVWALAFFARPAARGGMLALAAAAKFAPLALVPLFAAGERGLFSRGPERRRDRGPFARRLALGRAPVAFAITFAGVVILLLAHPAIDPGLATFWERTVESQLERNSPFSLWGQVEGIEWLQKLVLIAAAALALVVAFVPRRRDLPRVAALAAAVLIATQLAVDHWFYLYIPWFAAPLLIALASGVESDRSVTNSA